jgi:CHAT domain-containing protein
LEAVPRELCSVIADVKKKDYCAPLKARGVFGGLMLLDEEFTLENFERSLGKTPVVHVASHFSLNPGNESDSFLLLGGGAERKFSLDKLRKTRLDNIELLTLSACETAMTAGNKSNGVEVEGFGAMALNNGSKSVMATLWSVADASTQMLMTEFYRLKKENPTMSKSAALRAAQRAMIEGKLKAANAPFSHPYYWAPFVLIGNWR